MNNAAKSTILIVFLLFPAGLFSQVTTLVSPGGNNIVSFRINSTGAPEYSVTHSGNNFLSWSSLGLFVKGSDEFILGLSVQNTERNSIDETYPIVAGKSKYARNYCNQLTVTLGVRNDPAKHLKIIFRAYDDGIAFRYSVYEDGKADEFRVVRENTEFQFVNDFTAWVVRTDRFIQSYEGRYHRLNYSGLDKIVDSTGVTTRPGYDSLLLMPMTIQVNQNLFTSITEAEINNYAGTYLRKKGGNNILGTTLAPNIKDNSFSSLCSAPFETPWRVILIADNAAKLIESNIITSLNEPCMISDVSWIKPGKSAWEWWASNTGFDAGFGYGINDQTYKYYIDFASRNNLEYITVDAGWYGNVDKIDESIKKDITTSVPQLHLDELSRYAASKNVGIIVWALWYHVRDQTEEAFSYYNRLGIKGVKIDFMNRDDQEMVNFYRHVAETAAKYKLLIDFHGAYKPDGMNRTYPNLITREAVLANEYAKWDPDYPNPGYNVILPFTRMLAGAMDFTPGSMRNSKPQGYKPNYNLTSTLGTRTQQLAMFVVFESPLQYLCDSPPVYESSTGFAFIRKVPSSWDSTVVISGAIGEYIVIARKQGNDWYLGAMTSWQARDIRISFSFLDNVNYNAEVYSDTEDNYSNCSVQNITISKNSAMNFHLASGGGLAIRLSR